MKVEKTFTVRASPQTVWDFAKDPEKMAPCIPGCKDITAVDATRYKAQVAVKVGPISAKFNLDLEIVEETPPVEIISKTRGEEGTRASMLTADNVVRLRANDDGSTEVYCSSESSITGRLGKYGAGMMMKKADAIWEKLAQNVSEAIENRGQTPADINQRTGDRF
ncbi:MAG: SRPBCC domain-containing protein [Gammaproteobacteria bacterium]|nr:SRPBCC domain-containing protein [Gammaproteobacteria bacterium]